MSRVFIVSVLLEIPVVADSEEEAKDFVLDDETDMVSICTCSMLAQDDTTLQCEELTEESDRFPEWESSVPWGDDGDETIGERLCEDAPVEDDEAEQPGWGEPSHEDD